MPSEVPHEGLVTLETGLLGQYLFHRVLGDRVPLSCEKSYEWCISSSGAGYVYDMTQQRSLWVSALMPRELHNGMRHGVLQWYVRRKCDGEVVWFADLEKQCQVHD